jgi:hypothetical protein
MAQLYLPGLDLPADPFVGLADARDVPPVGGFTMAPTVSRNDLSLGTFGHGPQPSVKPVRNGAPVSEPLVFSSVAVGPSSRCPRARSSVKVSSQGGINGDPDGGLGLRAMWFDQPPRPGVLLPLRDCGAAWRRGSRPTVRCNGLMTARPALSAETPLLFPAIDRWTEPRAIKAAEEYGPRGEQVVSYLEMLAGLPGPMHTEVKQALWDDQTYGARRIEAAVSRAAVESGRSAAVRLAYLDGQEAVFRTHDAVGLELMDWYQVGNERRWIMEFDGLLAAALVVFDLLQDDDIAPLTRIWDAGLRSKKWGREWRLMALDRLASLVNR